jgi:hypothetical protein
VEARIYRERRLGPVYYKTSANKIFIAVAEERLVMKRAVAVAVEAVKVSVLAFHMLCRRTLRDPEVFRTRHNKLQAS